MVLLFSSFSLPFSFSLFLSTPQMNGFVSNFATESTTDYGASIMNCHDPVNVPAISTLGLQFAVFDRFVWQK